MHLTRPLNAGRRSRWELQFLPMKLVRPCIANEITADVHRKVPLYIWLASGVRAQATSIEAAIKMLVTLRASQPSGKGHRFV